MHRMCCRPQATQSQEEGLQVQMMPVSCCKLPDIYSVQSQLELVRHGAFQLTPHLPPQQWSPKAVTSLRFYILNWLGLPVNAFCKHPGSNNRTTEGLQESEDTDAASFLIMAEVSRQHSGMMDSPHIGESIKRVAETLYQQGSTT